MPDRPTPDDRAAGDAAASDPLIGAVVDARYRVVGLLGRGGMGAVYHCQNVRLHDRPCAMKVLAGLGTPRERARFDREIRTIAQLRSLHTVPVFDSGLLPDERPYVVMELLEGRGLDEALAAEPPTLSRALAVADHVLTALVEAHALGIVHRDLKPANLFLVREDGIEVTKVLDFGIAKQTRASEPALTRRNASMGTPPYMAPEQFRNEPTDGRTDLYALGLIVYEMLVGRRPFEADDPVPAALASMPVDARLAWMHLNREPPLVNGLSPQLQGWLTAMLRKARSERPADARSARDALRATPEYGGTPSSGLMSSGRSTLTALPKPPGRRRWQPIAAGVVVGVAGLVALVALVRRPTSAPPGTVEPCVERLATDPPGAGVFEDQTPLGVTPLPVERPCGTARWLRIERPGYDAVEVHLHGPSAMALGVIELVERPDGAAGGGSGAPDAQVDARGDIAPPSPVVRRPPKRRSRRRTPAPPSAGSDQRGPTVPSQPDPPAPADEPESTGGLDF